MVNDRTTEEVDGEITALLAQAGTLLNAEDLDGAAPLYRQVIELCETADDMFNKGKAKSSLGLIELRMGRPTEALRLFTEALYIYEILSDTHGVAAQCANLARVFTGVGAYADGLKYLLRALDLYSEINDDEGVARVTANIGKVYEATKDFSHALDYLGRAKDIYAKLGDQPMVGFVLGSIGSVHSNEGTLDRALVHYAEALEIFEKHDYTLGVAIACMFIASTLIQQGALDDAQTYLDMADEIQLTDPKMVIEREETRSSLLLERGELEAAEESLNFMMSLASEIGAKQSEMEIHKKLRDLARKRGDLDGYVEHNDLYMKLSEQLSGAETQRQLAMQTKERELASERQQREQERAILYSTLPRDIADRVLRGDTVSGDYFETAAVIFLDVVGFTALSSSIPPGHVVHLLDAIFTKCDGVCSAHNVTKIKTIGDSYMAVAFGRGHGTETDEHPNVRASLAAVELVDALLTLDVRKDAGRGDMSWASSLPTISVRVGIHSGPVVAGIIGRERLQYDVWGDTVNVASRMESTGEPGRIQVSEEFAKGLGRHAAGYSDASPLPSGVLFDLSLRGNVDVKGKGSMKTYWLKR